MNILFVIHTPKIPSASVYQDYRQRVAFLEGKGHRAFILAPEDFPVLRRWHSRWLPIVYPFFVALYLRNRDRAYDVATFHSYAGWVVNLFRCVVPTYRGLRTVTSFHGLESLYYCVLGGEMKKIGHPMRWRYRAVHGGLLLWLIRLSCRRSDGITCLNEAEASYLANAGWVDKSKIRILRHGVPNSFFTIRKSYPPTVRRLLYVGQWQICKGIRYLADAFAELAPERADWELWCVGTLAGEKQVLADFPEEIRDRIAVRPRVSQQELLSHYLDSDVFLFPSLFEGHSTALLESMATGLPIITTPVGSASDLLKDNESALIVPVCDALALVAAVRKLMDDAALRQKLGQHAQVAARAYELEKTHPRLLSFLQGLCGDQNSP